MTSFKLFAGTDVGLRDNNEDNFIVCPDLTKDEWMVPADQQEPIQLGELGCLVVVADGMGGMNAGEVASDIAVKTVQQMFAPSVLPADTVGKPESIKAYLKKVIVQADQQVKKRCKSDPETEGMGSTIVIAWLLDNKVYVAWLGDSRAYSFISEKGVIRLSKDHSYVQQLVDAKMLTEEEAMNHPESNVIVRSLGDVSQKAKPDIIEHTASEGEIILMCSDGLCGVCTDKEIAEVLRLHSNDLQLCKDALTNAALEAGGSDNITIALLQVVSTDTTREKAEDSRKKSKYLWSLLCLLALCIFGTIFSLQKCHDRLVVVENIAIQIDSTSICFGDSIFYRVVVSPQSADQSYFLTFDEKMIAVDTLARKISMKKNIQGKVIITAVSQRDSLIRDSVELSLQKKVVSPVSEVVSPVEEKVTISFHLNTNEALECGNVYKYTAIIKPDIVAKGGYRLTCSERTITIDQEKETVSLPAELPNVSNCSFTVTPASKPSSARKYVYQIRKSEITPSTGKNTETTIIQTKK